MTEGSFVPLGQYIAEEISRSGVNPEEELKRVEHEIAALRKEADRLLDNLTEANRDFVDEKLVGLRRRLREMEARQEELKVMAEGPLDVEAITAQALAQMSRFRDVLERGSIHERKEFLRGMVAGITLSPSEDRGTVTFYDLVPASFKCRAGTPDVPEKMPFWRGEERFRWKDEGWGKAA